jgi:type II secretory pathway pseudopilin PulG
MSMRRVHRISNQSGAGFTLIEIALSLTIIAFALIAIIGVLPHAMRVQRDNREETIINQDAVVLMDMLRSGSRGADDLTNYVLGIVLNTNISLPTMTYVNPTLGASFSFTNVQPLPLNSGSNIVGLMSIPKYRDDATNIVTVYMLAISGNAADQPPQFTTSIRDLAFGYRLTAEISPYFSEIAGTNATTTTTDVAIAQNLHTNLYELRLTFRWPLLPNGGVGSGRMSFRTLASGTMIVNPATVTGPDLFFLQPSTFTQAYSE